MTFKLSINQDFLLRLTHEWHRIFPAIMENGITIEAHSANDAAMQAARAIVPFLEKEMKELKENG